MANPYHSNENIPENPANYIAQYDNLLHVDRIKKLFKNRNKLPESHMMGVLTEYPHVYNVVEAEIEKRTILEAAKFKEIDDEVDAYLKEENKEKIQTGGDGNCFFYAIQGYGDIKGIPRLSINVSEMREAVAQTIEADIKKKRKDQLYATSFVSSSALQEHTAVIRQCKERGNSSNPYANEPDIIAFSDHFGVCIIVHDWNNTSLKKYHMNEYRYSDRTCGKKGNPVIDILRTNKIHYSLLMPIDDPEYNALKNLVESVSLPLKQDIVTAHQLQLQEMAKQAAVNLSRFRLNQPAASAAASSSALRNAPPYNFSFTPEQLAQQNAILENARKRAARAASSSSSAANRPLGLGNSVASPIVLNGLNMPWECSVCTFENQPNASNCTMCGAPKPASSSSSKPPASPIVINGIKGKSENLSSHESSSSSSNSFLTSAASQASANLGQFELNKSSKRIERWKKLLPEIDNQSDKETLQAKINAEQAKINAQRKGGTRKHKKLRNKKLRKTRQKQNKNNRKSKRKVRK